MSGIIRAMGKAANAAIAAIICYYFIAIPLGCTLAFKFDLGIHGLWFGMTAGMICICSYNQYLIAWQYDW